MRTCQSSFTLLKKENSYTKIRIQFSIFMSRERRYKQTHTYINTHIHTYTIYSEAHTPLTTPQTHLHTFLATHSPQHRGQHFPSSRGCDHNSRVQACHGNFKAIYHKPRPFSSFPTIPPLLLPLYFLLLLLLYSILLSPGQL